MADVVQKDRNSRINRLIDNLTLFDDTLMSMVFDDNIPATELLLKIILKRDDIEVVSVSGQKKWQGPVVDGRTIRLDILVRERSGKLFNVEVQRENAGAVEQRARYHSSMLDSRMLKEGQEFNELLDSYVIFITEKDYFKAGLPTYTVNRYVEELDRVFTDGSHIIYVNGSYNGNDELGTLLRDFKCKDSEDIFYPELAQGVRYFKEEGGRSEMCKAVEDYARDYAENYAKEKEIKSAIETAVDFNISREATLKRLCKKFDLTEKDAEAYYDQYAGVMA